MDDTCFFFLVSFDVFLLIDSFFHVADHVFWMHYPHTFPPLYNQSQQLSRGKNINQSRNIKTHPRKGNFVLITHTKKHTRPQNTQHLMCAAAVVSIQAGTSCLHADHSLGSCRCQYCKKKKKIQSILT